MSFIQYRGKLSTRCPQPMASLTATCKGGGVWRGHLGYMPGFPIYVDTHPQGAVILTRVRRPSSSISRRRQRPVDRKPLDSPLCAAAPSGPTIPNITITQESEEGRREGTSKRVSVGADKGADEAVENNSDDLTNIYCMIHSSQCARQIHKYLVWPKGAPPCRGYNAREGMNKHLRS